MSLTTNTVASDQGHWYDSITGEPRYTYVNKNGETKPTTLRQARSMNLVPSVTTILKSASAPGLRRYFDRMVWEATMTTPKVAGESDDMSGVAIGLFLF